MALNNPSVFNAALAGASAGVASRWTAGLILGPITTVQPRDAAIALATAIDAQIGPIPGGAGLSQAGRALLQTVTQATVEDRLPQSPNSLDYAAIATSIALIFGDILNFMSADTSTRPEGILAGLSSALAVPDVTVTPVPFDQLSIVEGGFTFPGGGLIGLDVPGLYLIQAQLTWADPAPNPDSMIGAVAVIASDKVTPVLVSDATRNLIPPRAQPMTSGGSTIYKTTTPGVLIGAGAFQDSGFGQSVIGSAPPSTSDFFTYLAITKLRNGI